MKSFDLYAVGVH